MKSVNADLLIFTFNVHLILGDQGPPGVKGIQNSRNTPNCHCDVLKYNFIIAHAHCHVYITIISYIYHKYSTVMLEMYHIHITIMPHIITTISHKITNISHTVISQIYHIKTSQIYLNVNNVTHYHNSLT